MRTPKEWKPPERADGLVYKLETTKRPKTLSLFPFLGVFVLMLFLFGGWWGRGWYEGSSNVPVPLTVQPMVPTATTVLYGVQTAIAGLWTPTPTVTLVPTVAPTETLSPEEWKLQNLPFCQILTPSTTPVECVDYRTIPAPTSTPTQTATPVPICATPTPVKNIEYGMNIIKVCMLVATAEPTIDFNKYRGW